jgi:hypothetical protein
VKDLRDDLAVARFEEGTAFDETVAHTRPAPAPTASAPAKPPQPQPQQQAAPDEPEQNVDDHLVLASLQPAVRLIHELRLGLRDLKRLSELASFRELRRAGLKLREVSEWLGISTAKAGLLSRHLKDRFGAAEAAQSLPRRIISVLWAVPLSEAGIAAALKDIPSDEVSQALAKLVAEGMLEPSDESTPRYRLVNSRYRLVNAPWTARIDGVNNLMTSIGNLLVGRLLRKDERSFVRTLQFHVRPKDFERLQQFYEVALFPLIDSIEAAAQQHPDDATPVQLSILWTPDYPGVDPDSEGEDRE